MGSGKIDCESIGLVSLLLIPWWVLAVAGRRLLRGRLRRVERLGYWVDRVAVAFNLFALPGAFFAASEVWTIPSPPIEKYLLSGAACYCAICAAALFVASILLHAHTEEYGRWREELRPWEAENAWESVADEDDRWS